MNASATPLPTTSQGYPFDKNLRSYLAEDLGKAFFANGTVASKGELHLYDLAFLVPDPVSNLRYEPVLYKGRELPVYVYTSSQQANLVDKYERLDLRPTEVGIFAWVHQGQVEFRLKLGSALLPISRLATNEAVRRVKVVYTLKALQAQLLSASRMLASFDQGQERLLDPLQAGSLEDLAQTANITSSHEKPDYLRRASPPPYRPGQIDVVVGLFFDGTSNNRYCTELTYNQVLDSQTGKMDKETVKAFAKQGLIPNPYDKKKPKIKVKDFMVTLTKDTSYLNPYSSIVLLHDLYQTRMYNSYLRGRQEVVIKHYVQGIGTLVDLDDDGFPVEYYEDDVMGNASGRGVRGVIMRVEQGLTHVAKQLQQILAISNAHLGTLTFDVFGFSRGAAAARHCLNELLRPIKNNTDELPYGRFGTALNSVQVDLPKKLNLRFAGLFDTVVSDSMSENSLRKEAIEIGALKNWELESLEYETRNSYEPIYTSLKEFSGKAVHIVAQDEYRSNFPLTKNDAPNKTDLYLLGAHSDIGGGYAAYESNTVVTYLDISALQAYQTQVLLDAAAKAYRERFTRVLKNGRWVVDDSRKRTKHQRRVLPELSQKRYVNGKTELVYNKHYYIVDSGYISNELPLVAMNAVLRYALAEGVPFQLDLRKVKVPKAKFYELPKDPIYQRYYAIVMKLVQESKKDNNLPIPYDIYYPLSEHYVHESAGYNSSLIFEVKGEDYSLYANEPNKVSVIDNRPAGDRRREYKDPASREK